MLCWQLLIWTVFFNVAPHSGLYSRLLTVLDERTRSVSARHRRHQRSASVLGSSTSCINMSCHYHSEASKSPSCQPKAGLQTHAAVCVWFGGVSGMWSTRPWLVPRCTSAHSRSGSTHRAQKANRGTLQTDEDTLVHLCHCPDILTKKYDPT